MRRPRTKISTGLPSQGQPLNCHAGPMTKTATTRSQSAGCSFCGESMTRYGTVRLPSLRRCNRISLSRRPPAERFSSVLINLSDPNDQKNIKQRGISYLRSHHREGRARDPKLGSRPTSSRNSGSKRQWTSRGKRKGKKKATHLRSCSTSLALNMVMSDVLADGMMMMGVRETRFGGPADGRCVFPSEKTWVTKTESSVELEVWLPLGRPRRWARPAPERRWPEPQPCAAGCPPSPTSASCRGTCPSCRS